MPRATKLLPAANRNAVGVADTLILNYAQRTTQRGFVFGVKGTCVEFDFAEPVHIRTDDALELDDGSYVDVVADPEPLLEARAADPAALARLAWMLGDRHVPVEIRPKSLRVRREPAVEQLLQALGASATAIDAPFEPEGGAYAVPIHGQHAHLHDHAHGHDLHHGHHHHDHDHSHGHGHHRHDDDHAKQR